MTWEELLTDFEEKLDSIEAALRDGNDLDESLFEPFVPPQDMPPLPKLYMERVVAILQRNKEVTDALAVRKAEVGSELKASAQLASVKSKSPFSDTPIPKYFNEAV